MADPMSAAAPQTATCTSTFQQDRLAAAAMWARLLEPIPTQLGKLVSVASFRVGISTDYRHPNLDRVLSPEAAQQALRESHEHLFAEWVGLFLEEQSEDVRRYLAALPQKNARELLLQASESLIPPTATPVARRAFLSDLDAIFILAAHTSPASSPRETCEALQPVA
jgi:hypothetical protein